MIDEIGQLKRIEAYSLGTHIYDDFNDNSKNTNIWDTDGSDAGTTTAISETGGQTKISNAGGGGDVAGYAWRPTVKKFEKSLEIKADIQAVAEEAGIEAYLELYVDANNYFQFGMLRNNADTINSRGYVTYRISGAAEVTVDVDAVNIDVVEREYKIIVDEHHVHVYLDRDLLGTYAFEGLTNYVVRMVAGTIDNTDTMDIRFDNFEILSYWEKLREIFAELESIHGGSESIQTVYDLIDAGLDLARSGDSGTSAFAVAPGNVIVLYEESSTTAFEFGGGFIDWTLAANFGAGENTKVEVEIKVKSGGAYVQIYEETFLAVAAPSPICAPVPRESTSQPTPSKLYNVYGVKVTATQAAVGGGWNTIEHEWYDAKT